VLVVALVVALVANLLLAATFGAAEARTLIVCTPAGFERYVDRIAARGEEATFPRGLQAVTGGDHGRSTDRRAGP
jgi:hypothetical protein